MRRKKNPDTSLKVPGSYSNRESEFAGILRLMSHAATSLTLVSDLHNRQIFLSSFVDLLK